MAEYICKVCGYEGKGRKCKRGSGKAEFWIWALVLIPGPFYSIWRRVGIKRECSHCNVPTLVKLNSEQGQLARRKMDIELGLIQVKKPEEKKVEETKPVVAFGNDRPAERVTKKPVNPEEW
jgi:hypothetical protein